MLPHAGPEAVSAADTPCLPCASSASGASSASDAGSESDASTASDSGSDSDPDASAADPDAASELAGARLCIEGPHDRSELVTVGSGRARHAVRLRLAQQLSDTLCLILDVSFLPPLPIFRLRKLNLAHFHAFKEGVAVRADLAHRRRVQEGAGATHCPKKQRAAPPKLRVDVVSECSFKVIRLGPLALQFKTRKIFGALPTASAEVLLDRHPVFSADLADVPRAPREPLRATLARELRVHANQRYEVALSYERDPAPGPYSGPAPGSGPSGRGPSGARAAPAPAPWRLPAYVDAQFRRIELWVLQQIDAQDMAARAGPAAAPANAPATLRV
jgi:hypothetical protein